MIRSIVSIIVSAMLWHLLNMMIWSVSTLEYTMILYQWITNTQHQLLELEAQVTHHLWSWGEAPMRKLVKNITIPIKLHRILEGTVYVVFFPHIFIFFPNFKILSLTHFLYSLHSYNFAEVRTHIMRLSVFQLIYSMQNT